MVKVVVIGATGMLGSMVAQELAKDPAIDLHITTRPGRATAIQTIRPGNCCALDAKSCHLADLEFALADATWAINCIGIIKPHIHDQEPRERDMALRVNALFPHLLAAAGERVGCRIIQIATDCVYSGTNGGYLESDHHDGWDVYGKTKSLGEVPSRCFNHLRCSIIGPEFQGKSSLLEWFLNQKRDSHVRGYTNHFWNGITTLHFAKLCRGIILNNLILPGICHVLPADSVSKGELLNLFASTYGRNDIVIEMGLAEESIDRTLATSNPEVNTAIWRSAGYAEPPTIEQMLSELALLQHYQVKDLA